MLLAAGVEGCRRSDRARLRAARALPPALESTECTYGCPIGSIALELHEPDPAVRRLLAANFAGWLDAIEQCFVDAGDRLPADVDRRALAVFALRRWKAA